MDWSIVGGILAGAAAVWAAVYTLLRERAPMRELERVTAVLKDTPEGAAHRPHLEAVRDHLCLRINFAYRAPREFLLLSLGWTGLLGGLAMFVFVFILEFFGEGATPAWASLGLGICTGVLVTLGRFALYSRWRVRRNWLNDVVLSSDIRSTERSLV